MKSKGASVLRPLSARASYFRRRALSTAGEVAVRNFVVKVLLTSVLEITYTPTRMTVPPPGFSLSAYHYLCAHH
jgi:hypothetical protein